MDEIGFERWGARTAGHPNKLCCVVTSNMQAVGLKLYSRKIKAAIFERATFRPTLNREPVSYEKASS